MTARLARTALRLGLAGAGAILGFALMAAADDPAYANDQPPRALPAPTVKPPKGFASQAPEAVKPQGPDRRANNGKPRATQENPVEHLTTEVTRPIRHALQETQRATEPVTQLVGEVLDAAPEPVRTPLTAIRTPVATTVDTVGEDVGTISPALGDTVDDATAPLAPILGTPSPDDQPLLPLPLELIETEEPAAPTPGATSSPSAGAPTPEPASMPTGTYAESRPTTEGPRADSGGAQRISEPAGDSREPADASGELPDPTGQPAPLSQAAQHNCLDSSPAALPTQPTLPVLHGTIAPASEPHRPAGRAPKPTPGPA
ncbi:hypothetical protein [Micromonospora sp. NPDC047730]|uniref:hypothetical protein n=1 Tax=Micromonospora sp. NPDC047730 TaxID=3364253 RepID=UPI003715E030